MFSGIVSKISKFYRETNGEKFIVFLVWGYILVGVSDRLKSWRRDFRNELEKC